MVVAAYLQTQIYLLPFFIRYLSLCLGKSSRLFISRYTLSYKFSKMSKTMIANSQKSKRCPIINIAYINIINHPYLIAIVNKLQWQFKTFLFCKKVYEILLNNRTARKNKVKQIIGIIAVKIKQIFQNSPYCFSRTIFYILFQPFKTYLY